MRRIANDGTVYLHMQSQDLENGILVSNVSTYMDIMLIEDTDDSQTRRSKARHNYDVKQLKRHYKRFTSTATGQKYAVYTASPVIDDAVIAHTLRRWERGDYTRINLLDLD